MKFSKFFKTKWRVVTDNYSGYEIQKKFWWLPVWLQANRYGEVGVGTFCTVDEAMRTIAMINEPKFKPKVVATYEP